MPNPSLYRLTLLVAMMLLASAPIFAQEQKFGFVNTIRILQESNEGKARTIDWETKFKAEQQKMDAETQELQRLQQQAAEQGRSLNPEALAELQRTIEDKSALVRRMQEDANRILGGERDTIVREISEKIQALLNEYAETNGYDAIFLRHPDQQVFVAESVDITNDILRIYNERH